MKIFAYLCTPETTGKSKDKMTKSEELLELAKEKESSLTY